MGTESNPNQIQRCIPMTTESTQPIPILFVNYHGTMGGGQVHLLTLLDGLDRNQFQPFVVCCQDGSFCEHITAQRIEPILIPFGKAKYRYILTAIKSLWKMWQVLMQKKIRLVQVIGIQEAKLAALPCWWLKIPMLWIVAP
jgi:hypothetical protein